MLTISNCYLPKETKGLNRWLSDRDLLALAHRDPLVGPCIDLYASIPLTAGEPVSNTQPIERLTNLTPEQEAELQRDVEAAIADPSHMLILPEEKYFAVQRILNDKRLEMEQAKWAAIPEPTENDRKDPRFQAIWDVIKHWDIERYYGAGRAGATGTDVMAILASLRQKT